MLSVIDSSGKSRADHIIVLSTFLYLNIFTMNDSGGKSQKKSKDKILKILYVLAAATEAPSFGMDLFELKKKKKKNTGGTGRPSEN